ncbi:hypothetical protein [Cohnella zeiphila]|uniref:Uncharacterized protein n=1 Tax=Cohnella zeiphila TaxID=2761120 RepID=A0A7X0SNY7_9BACL|nr:hypothetical protein [Cohnella zeiphila]MBB6733487.1 hypothetical protein [Cohnella zeiphila]
MKTNKTSEDDSFLFQVEILVHAPTNGVAMERLLHALNAGEFADFRIQSGIQLGARIEQELSQTPLPEPPPADDLDSRIRGYINSNKLIRVNVNRGKGVKMSMPCRVVNYDPDKELLTLYHVDEKRVYSIRLNEVDDFVDG